jgi:hypothetical protein
MQGGGRGMRPLEWLTPAGEKLEACVAGEANAPPPHPDPYIGTYPETSTRPIYTIRLVYDETLGLSPTRILFLLGHLRQ